MFLLASLSFFLFELQSHRSLELSAETRPTCCVLEFAKMVSFKSSAWLLALVPCKSMAILERTENC